MSQELCHNCIKIKRPTPNPVQHMIRFGNQLLRICTQCRHDLHFPDKGAKKGS